jgi:hypothetical protein
MLWPGIQKVFMLMMGDRATGPGTMRMYGYSPSWGGGRAKMRRIDDTGMDAPWGRANNYVCVGQSENVIIDVKNGQRLSEASDSFKAVLWWYTASFTEPVPNDIDLQLQWSNDGIVWSTIRSDTGSDLKKMVYYNGVGNHYLRLKVTGTQVNDQHGDGGDCLAWSPSFPNGKARVYYMWMYEDDARDDQDGPDSGIETL